MTEIKEAVKNLFEGLNIQVCEALEENQIIALPTTRDGLKQFHFTCPLCKQRKTADNMELIRKPLKIEQKEGDKFEFIVSQEQLVCCRECSQKYFLVHEWKGG